MGTTKPIFFYDSRITINLISVNCSKYYLGHIQKQVRLQLPIEMWRGT